MKKSAIVVKSQEEMERLQAVYGKETLYIDWNPQMAKVPTAVTILGPETEIYSVGSAYFKHKDGFELFNIDMTPYDLNDLI